MSIFCNYSKITINWLITPNAFVCAAPSYLNLLKHVPFSKQNTIVQMQVFQKIIKLFKKNFYRDFAYVARDRLTRIHMCHVFRCDTAARTIANTLRYIVLVIRIRISLKLYSLRIQGHLQKDYDRTITSARRQWCKYKWQW